MNDDGANADKPLELEDRTLNREWAIGFIAGRYWGYDICFFLDFLSNMTLIEIILDLREGKDRK